MPRWPTGDGDGRNPDARQVMGRRPAGHGLLEAVVRISAIPNVRIVMRTLGKISVRRAIRKRPLRKMPDR